MNFQPKNIAVIGSSGAIGGAFAQLLKNACPHASLHCFSHTQGSIDYRHEASIQQAAERASEAQPLDLVIVACGILHQDNLMPEKSLKDLSAEKLKTLLEANLITPSLLAKHFIPTLNKQQKSVFAVLSARVGSISDNRLGGWYAYRASKAGLNMCLKNAAIETARRNNKAIIVGLHPGTVDSNLSKPFQARVPENKLFTPEYSVGKLMQVIDNLSQEHSGKVFAWDSKEVPA